MVAVDHSLLDGNSARASGAIAATGGTTTVTNSTIKHNTATQEAGAVFDLAILTISGSTISGNSTPAGGGGVEAQSGTVTITDSMLTGNTAGFGGALAVDEGTANVTAPTVTVADNSIISGNTATSNQIIGGGGGVWINFGTLTISDSIVGEAVVGTAGGGTTTFPGNTASDGGGINIAGGSVILSNQSAVVGNTATGTGQFDGGGGILVQSAGDLTVSDSTVGMAADGTTNSASYGGGIYDWGGYVTIASGSTVNGNQAAVAGGAIYVQNGTFTVSDSTVSQNEAGADGGPGQSALGGGAFYINGGSVLLSDSMVTSNAANGNGGGVYLNGGGMITVAGGSTLSGNQGLFGGGAYLNGGTMTVTDSTLSGNTAHSDGGGINNRANLMVSDSTLSGNIAERGDGGGIDNFGTLTVSNSTFNGNSAVLGSGGGIANGNTNSFLGTVTVSDSTLSGNTANVGGGMNNANGYLNLQNTIVAGNTASSDNAPDLGAPFTDSGNNLLGFKVYASGSPPSSLNDQILGPNAALDLAPLGYYGGPTQTMALLPGSKAIGNANSSALDVPPTDQRGFFRLLQGSIDIGAYQTQAGDVSNGAFVVTTAADPGLVAGRLSLREAINVTSVYAASLGSGSISFDPGLAGQTIILDGTQLPQLNDNVQITGLGASQLAVSGNNQSRVFAIAQGAVVTISELTIEHGNADVSKTLNSGNGGGIANQGSLTLMHSIVTGSFAGFGGGIANYGAGHAMLSDTTVSGNSAFGLGGGIGNEGTASMTLMDSTVSGNTARGGGGIFNGDTAALTLAGSTVAGNVSTINWGGGINNWGGPITLAGSTISGNTAAVAGGGVYNLGSSSLTVADSTISGNTAPIGPGINFGGAYNNTGGSLTLASSIVAGNSPANAPDINGTITSDLGHNLLSTKVTASGAGDMQTSNPLLAPLGYYGGPTQTMPPLPHSPALGKGGPVTTISAFAAKGSMTLQVQNAATIASTSGTYTILVDGQMLTVTDILNTNTLVLQAPLPAPVNAGDLVFPAFDQRGFPLVGSIDIGACQTQVQPLQVTTTADPGRTKGQLSLREAVDLANAYAISADPATVTFAPGLNGGTITLAAGAIDVNGFSSSGTATITIDGGGQITISGNNATTVFHIEAGVTADLKDLTITQGLGTGGGAFNSGSLTVDTDTFTADTSTSWGGAIYNVGALTVNNSQFLNNTAPNAGGGAIVNDTRLTVTNSIFKGNSSIDGGAIQNWFGATATISNSTLSGNTAINGGAIFNFNSLNLASSTLSGNTATNRGGAVYNAGTLMVNTSTLSGNSCAVTGGGIDTFYSNTASTTIANCTISGNSAQFGGGIGSDSGTTTVISSTVYGNSATGNGGGIVGQKLHLTDSTISGNSAPFGGGVQTGASFAASQSTLVNTIVAGNTATVFGPDLNVPRGSVAGSNNLIGDGTGTVGLSAGSNGNQVGTSAQPINPLLAPLGYYGGPTETMPLLPFSPALGKGGPITTIALFAAPGSTTLQVQDAAAVASTAGTCTILVDGNLLTITSVPASNTLVLQNALPAAVNAGAAVLPAFDQRGLPLPGQTDIGACQTQVQPLQVTTSADPGRISGQLSLREAVNLANAYASNGDPATVTFAPGLNDKTITLTAGVLDLNGSPSSGTAAITIDGGGRITVSGNKVTTVFQIEGGVSADLKNLTISQGLGIGGAALNEGSLTVDTDTFAGNTSISWGGAIYNVFAGALIVNNSKFLNNAASIGGGAIFNGTGAEPFALHSSLTLTNSTLSGNSSFEGGAIENYSGATATVSNATLAGNTATNGGAILNFSSLNLGSSTLSGNTATNRGGGIFNAAALTVNNSTLSGNSCAVTGGGVETFYSNTASTTITNCTISGNLAQFGGGVGSDSGTTTLISSTVYGNSVTGNGGGIVGQHLTLLDSTISGNTAPFGGGVQTGASFASSQSTLVNTIVARNTATISDPDLNVVQGTVSGSNNLIGDGTGTVGLSAGSNGNQVGASGQPINPLLAPLGNYGGPTQTMALLPGSPALGAGSAASSPPTTDQRGQPRRLDSNQNPIIDIGAFESQGFTLTAVAGASGQLTAIRQPFANPLAATITANNSSEPVKGGTITYTPQPAANGPSATLSSTTAVISNGLAAVTAIANNSIGTYIVIASSRAGSTSFSLTNGSGPAFSGAAVATFVVGNAGTVTIAALGFPPPSLSESSNDTRPAWLGFTPQTGVLAGTPPAGSAGTYTLNFAAANPLGVANEMFTLTVIQPPAITSANNTTFTAGSPGTFPITTSPGSPATTTVAESGALPGQVTFQDNGDGTATLAGNPAPLSGGTYALTITAATSPVNGVSATVTQAFTLTINEAPTITSPKSASFTVNTLGTFTVTTTGFPAPTIQINGLPGGLKSTAGSSPGTAVISGTPAAGTSRSNPYTITITAKNGIGAVATQTLSLTVNPGDPPVASSALTITAPTSYTSLGKNLFRGTFLLQENPGVSLTGALTISGFTNLPPGVTFVSSTSTKFLHGSKTLQLTLVFKNTTRTALATLLRRTTPLVDETFT